MQCIKNYKNQNPSYVCHGIVTHSTDAESRSILVHRIHTSTLLRGRKVKAVQKIVCSIHNITTKEHPTHYLPLSLQLIDILYI